MFKRRVSLGLPPFFFSVLNSVKCVIVVGLVLGKGKKLFNKIHIEITNVCNLSCSFCPVTKRKPVFMSANLFEKALSESVPLTDRISLHVKGEPLLHPNFEKLMDIAGRYNAKVELTTNGTLINKHSPLLLSKSLVQINFSLHSLSAAFSLQEYIASIHNFILKMHEYNSQVYVNLRMWDYDEEKYSSKSLLLKELRKYYEFGEVNIDVRQKKNIELTHRVYLHFDTTFEWPAIEAEPLSDRGFCYGLSNHIGILADGTVVPCCLDGEGVINLGDIASTPLVKILESPRAVGMKEGFYSFNLHEPLCKTCGFARRFKKVPKHVINCKS